MPAEQVERDVYGELLNARANRLHRLPAKGDPQPDAQHEGADAGHRRGPRDADRHLPAAADLPQCHPVSGKRTEGATDLCRNGPGATGAVDRSAACRAVRDVSSEEVAQRQASCAASPGTILPLRRPSDLGSAPVRRRILELTDGITVRIFRLNETAAAEAVRSGKEAATLESFDGDDLVLLLVAMIQHTERQLRRQATR